MVPESLRQAAWPLHICAAPPRPPSWAKSSPVSICRRGVDGVALRFSAIDCASTILPGFMTPSGSNARLTSWKAP